MDEQIRGAANNNQSVILWLKVKVVLHQAPLKARNLYFQMLINLNF